MSSKKEQVIKTAKELFSQYGYRKVSMDELAQKAGVTKKTIYTYFKDKNDLIKYFLYDELNKIREISNVIDKKPISFDQKIYEQIIEMMEYRNNSKLLMNFFKEDSGNFEIAAECIRILNATVQDELKLKLEKAIADNYIKECDTEIVSFLIYKIYIALMFELDKPLDKKEAAENIMNILRAWLFK